MAKKNGVQSVESNIANRREIESRIQGICSRLGQLTNLNQIGIACAESRTKAESFLGYHGKGNESEIPDAKINEYTRLKEDAKATRETYLIAKSEDEDLRSELAELNLKLHDMGRQAAADDVLKYQAKVASIENHISGLKQAITREKEKVNCGNAISDVLASLQREREDLLADVAIGGPGNPSRLTEIEAQIAGEEARILETKSVGKSAEAVVAGLLRKVDESEKALDEAKDILETVYCDFLISEAEREGIQFTDLSNKLWDKFSKIIALGTMIENHPKANGASIISGDCRDFKIPVFKLGSCPETPQSKGFQKTFSELDLSAVVESAKDEMAALGIK